MPARWRIPDRDHVRLHSARRVMPGMQDVANNHSYFFEEGAYDCDHTSTIESPTYKGERVYLRLTNGHDEVVVPVDRIVVDARVYASETVQSNLTEAGEYDGHPFVTGVTPIDGKDARLVVAGLPGGGSKMMGKFDYDFGERASADKQRNTNQRTLLRTLCGRRQFASRFGFIRCDAASALLTRLADPRKRRPRVMRPTVGPVRSRLELAT
jgi:hypothetical protein